MGSFSSQCMYILLYLKFIGEEVSINLWSMGGTSALSIWAFCYMWNLFGVVVLHRSMVNWRRGVLITCILCYLWKYSRDLCSIRGGPSALSVWSILLYVKLLWCTGISEIYGQLEEGGILLCVKIIWCMVFHTSIVNWRRGFAICASCFLWNFFWVVVFQRSMII